MSELSKHWQIYLIGVGAVAAWSGFTFYGLGMTYRESRDLDVYGGLIAMVIGLILLAVGIWGYMRRPEDQR